MARDVAAIRLGIVFGCVACMCSCNGQPADDGPAAVAPPRTQLKLRVTGHNFQWRIRYAGGDGQLDTDDDLITAQNVHLPVHASVELDLRSEDYAYTLFLPHWDLIETAIPADPYVLRFETDGPATYELLGSQMCGYTHPLLLGKVVIRTRTGFDEWLSSFE